MATSGDGQKKRRKPRVNSGKKLSAAERRKMAQGTGGYAKGKKVAKGGIFKWL